MVFKLAVLPNRQPRVSGFRRFFRNRQPQRCDLQENQRIVFSVRLQFVEINLSQSLRLSSLPAPRLLMAITSSPPKSSSKNANLGWRITVYLSVFIGVALLFAFFVLMFGKVEGVEFSPSRFQTRHFSVHEIPWLKIQVSPIRRTTSQSATARYLLAQSLIQPLSPTATTATQPRLQPAKDGKPASVPPTASPAATTAAEPWHLVTLTRGGIESRPADAKLLTDQLENPRFNQVQSNDYWHDWSSREPAKAKVLWPVIQKLAFRELYILMPTLFAFALDSADDMALKRSIDEYLQKSYAELVVELRNAGREELAAELLREAITDFPNDPKLQALR
jgi:hypothetical protein